MRDKFVSSRDKLVEGLTMENERPPLPGVTEIAQHFRIPEQTIYDQRCRGVGLGALGFRVGKHLRFRWEDIDRFIDEQRAAAPSGPSRAA